jgi:hypothetical protein
MQCACAILHCHLWPVWIYHISSTLSEKRQDFREKLLNILERVFWSSLQFLAKTFLTLRSTERYSIINAHSSSCISAWYSYQTKET